MEGKAGERIERRPAGETRTPPWMQSRYNLRNLMNRGKEEDKVEVAKEIIRGLLAVIDIKCENLHHGKKDRHNSWEECPVEKRINDGLIKRAYDFTNDFLE